MLSLWLTSQYSLGFLNTIRVMVMVFVYTQVTSNVLLCVVVAAMCVVPAVVLQLRCVSAALVCYIT